MTGQSSLSNHFLLFPSSKLSHPATSFFCLYLKMVFKMVTWAISGNYSFSWVSPMYTRSIHINQLLFVFILLIFYYRKSQPGIQKGKEKIFLLLYNVYQPQKSTWGQRMIINTGCCVFEVVDAVAGKLSGWNQRKPKPFTIADLPCEGKIVSRVWFFLSWFNLVDWRHAVCILAFNNHGNI